MKQNVVSRSSVEAEYISMANAVSEVIWITTLSKELNNDVATPVVVYSDRKVALQIAAVTPFI